MSQIWVNFSTSSSAPLKPPAAGVARHVIQNVVTLKGQPLPWRTGALLTRSESTEPPVSDAHSLTGVVQHLGYTSAELRAELRATSSAAVPDGLAVLIPIKKSATWWDLAQDERQALLHGTAAKGAHFEIGRRYASRIHRRLLHSRYVPLSSWDFLTYFEFPRAEEAVFRSLLAELRSPEQNPEWNYVERETEVWLAPI